MPLCSLLIDALAPEIEIKSYTLDFVKAEQRDFSRLRAILHDLDIYVLINNVGMSHAHPLYFYEENEDVMEAMVKVNVMGSLRMTKLVLSQMLQRKSGLIVNVGSFAGEMPTFLLQT